MRSSRTFAEIYGRARPMTRTLLNDVVASASATCLAAFASQPSMAVAGAFKTVLVSVPPPGEPSAIAAAALGACPALPVSFSVHRGLPSLVGGAVDVLQIRALADGATWSLALAPERLLALHSGPALLKGVDGGAWLAVAGEDLLAALDASAHIGWSPPHAALLPLLATARGRRLLKSYPPAVTEALAARQGALDDAVASPQARVLAERGAPPLVPLRVSRDDLSGAGGTPIGLAVRSLAWTVRQPILAGPDGAITGYAAAGEGIAHLARDFGPGERRTLWLDAESAEYDLAGRLDDGTRRKPTADPLAVAVKVSAAITVQEAADAEARGQVWRRATPRLYGVTATR